MRRVRIVIVAGSLFMLFGSTPGPAASRGTPPGQLMKFAKEVGLC